MLLIIVIHLGSESVIKDNTDILMVSETKIDDTFPALNLPSTHTPLRIALIEPQKRAEYCYMSGKIFPLK